MFKIRIAIPAYKINIGPMFQSSVIKRNNDVKHVELLTPWSRILAKKPIVGQLVKKFTTFYGSRRFITVFTEVRH